jgi:hypothetical protein
MRLKTRGCSKSRREKLGRRPCVINALRPTVCAMRSRPVLHLEEPGGGTRHFHRHVDVLEGERSNFPLLGFDHHPGLRLPDGVRVTDSTPLKFKHRRSHGARRSGSRYLITGGAPCRSLNDLRIVPSGVNPAPFPVLFPRNVEPHRVGFQNRRDLGEFLTGGW